MNKLTLFFLLFIIILSTTLGIAQQSYQIETTILQGRRHFWGHHNWRDEGRPFIEVNYGETQPAIKDFVSDFSQIGYGAIKLGYSTLESGRRSPLHLENNYVFLSRYSKNLKDFDENAELENNKVKMTSFGLGNRFAYGYDLATVSLFPYHQLQLVWTDLDSEVPAGISVPEEEKLRRIEGRYRFGVSTESGVQLSLYKSVSFIGGYEATVVYPRVVFWKWLGGTLLQGLGLEAVSHFAEQIVEFSPAFGPVMYALLRGGASYLIFTGMQNKMYWPIGSEKPLSHETFKAGFAIRF